MTSIDRTTYQVKPHEDFYDIMNPWVIDLTSKYDKVDSNLQTKPSDILMYAYEQGIGKIEKDLEKDGKFCATAVMVHLQKHKGFSLNEFLRQKYGEKYHEQSMEMMQVFSDLMKYNDSSPSVTFKDCAEFMRERGF